MDMPSHDGMSTSLYRYLTASSALTAFIVLLPLCVLLYSQYTTYRRQSSTDVKVPGCARLGLMGRSNLKQHSLSQDHESEHSRVQALFVYPIKSCRGVELSTSQVTGLGLKYDRLFSFAQLVSKRTSAQDGDVIETAPGIVHEWRFITQREFPKLALLETEIHAPRDETGPPTRKYSGDDGESWSSNGGCLIVKFPYESDDGFFAPRRETITLRLPLMPSRTRIAHKQYPLEQMTIWKDRPQSLNMTSEIDPDDLAKLKYFLGVSNPLGLFRVDDLNLRPVTRSLPKDRRDGKFSVGFADAFPVHLLNTASVRALNASLPTTSAIKGDLDPRRFRANVYISGPHAYAEDRWMRFTVGGAAKQYHVACRTARCTLPNVHPETGSKDRNEPHATMKRVRQVDEGAKPHPCLGLSIIPLFGEGQIAVGDQIEVLETGELVYEKMFK